MAMWVCIVLLVAVATVYILVESIYAKYSALSVIPGPGKKGRGTWWLIGDALNLASHPVGVFYQQYLWIKQYGNICLHWILLKPVILISDAAAIHHIIHSGKYDDKDQAVYGLLEPLIGKGLVVSGGHKWKEQRTIAEPAFHRRIIHSFIPKMEKAAEQLCELMTLLPERTTIDVDNTLISLTLDVIGQTALGVDFGLQKWLLEGHTSSSKQPPQIVSSFSDIFEELNEKIVNPARPYLALLGLYGWKGFIGQFKYYKSAKYLKKYIRSIIRQRAIELSSSSPLSESKTLLDFLLKSEMTEDVILDECLTFLVAGHDTCAHTIAWCLHIISTHYDVEQKVLSELRSLFNPSESQINVSEDSLTKMVYLKAVVQETLRLYPPVALSLRVAAEDDVIGPYPVPKGTCVCLFMYGAQRDPSYWPNSDSFIPERFMRIASGETQKREMGSYGPFSWGKRVCIGQYFAMTEIMTVIAKVIWKFHLESDPAQVIGIEQRLTNRAIHGLRFYPHPRSAN